MKCETFAVLITSSQTAFPDLLAWMIESGCLVASSLIRFKYRLHLGRLTQLFWLIRSQSS